MRENNAHPLPTGYQRNLLLYCLLNSVGTQEQGHHNNGLNSFIKIMNAISIALSAIMLRSLYQQQMKKSNCGKRTKKLDFGKRFDNKSVAILCNVIKWCHMIA